MLEAQGEWALFTDADLSAPIEELEKLWGAVEREHAQVAIGSRALDRSLIGVHQPRFARTCGRLFNLVMRLVDRPAVSRHAMRLQAVRDRAPRARSSAASGWKASASTWKCCSSPATWATARSKCRCDGTTSPGTKVSVWRGLLAFLDPSKVRWNGMTGKYR